MSIQVDEWYEYLLGVFLELYATFVVNLCVRKQTFASTNGRSSVWSGTSKQDNRSDFVPYLISPYCDIEGGKSWFSCTKNKRHSELVNVDLSKSDASYLMFDSVRAFFYCDWGAE